MYAKEQYNRTIRKRIENVKFLYPFFLDKHCICVYKGFLFGDMFAFANAIYFRLRSNAI